MKNNTIHGVGVALITPFTPNEKVDYDALGRVVESVMEGGVDYIVALGTTAETPTLSRDEQSQILKCIKERNTMGLPLVVGVGGNCTSAVVDAIAQTNLDGVDAVLSVTPYYNKPSQQGLFEHYKKVAQNSPRPILLYNVPGRTGVNMSAETTIRIANQVDNVLGIKEACGSLLQMSQLLKNRPEGFLVISGDDAMVLPLNQIGGDGVISVVANAFPAQFTQMYRASVEGDMAAAAAHSMRLFEVIEAMFEEGNPAGVKGAMSINGLVENVLRLPLIPASERLIEKIRKLVADNKL